jgi:hypothetical protein
MWESSEARRRVGRTAWAAAWVALVVGQLHALSRHATADGKADLDLSLTAFWAEPAARVLRPLLDWGDPDLVYLTYGKLWMPLFAAFTAGAFLAYRHRRPVRFEKWAWRVALGAYVGATVSVGLQYWTQLADYNALFDVAFLVALPVMLLTMLSSTVLGVTLLVKGFRPRTSAVLLALTVPGVFVITMVTSLGNVVLPIMFAYGIVGRRIAQSQAVPDGEATRLARAV